MKKLVIVLFVFALFLVSAPGCDSLPNLPWSKTNVIAPIGRGIDFEFRTNEPPKNLVEGATFIVGIDVYNYMLNPLDVKINLRDLKGAYTNVDEFSKKTTLEEAYLIGDDFSAGMEEFTFPEDDNGEFSYNRLPEGREITTQIFADISFGYKERVNPSICIKGRSSDLVGVKCQDIEILTEKDIHQVLNAPIAITRIKKELIPTAKDKVNVRLTLDIENKGKGKLAMVDLQGRENGNDNEAEKRIQRFNIDFHSQKGKFSCIGPGVKKMTGGYWFDLRNNKNTIVCTSVGGFELGDTDFIEEILDISYVYGYVVTKSVPNIKIVSTKQKQIEKVPIPGSENTGHTDFADVLAENNI